MARKLLITLGVLLAVLVIAAIVLVMSFDANRFKPRIQEYVATRYQRTLTIDGDLSLSVFPRIAISVPATRLSERNAAEPVASVGAARVSVELLPLLRGAVVTDKVRVDKLTATVVRRRDGSLSIDDLLGRGARPASGGPAEGEGGGGIGPTAIDIGGIEIIDAQLRYVDEAAARTLAVNELDLVAGAIAARGTTPVQLSFVVRSDQPRGEARVSVTGDLQLDLVAGTASGAGLQATIAAQAELDPQRRLTATLEANGVDVNTESLAAETIKLVARLVEPTRTVDAKLAGPLTGDFGTRVFEMPRLAGPIEIADPALPEGKLTLPIEASLKADIGHERIALDTRTTVEGSQIHAKASGLGFATPKIGFDLQADKLDLDRIAPPIPTASPAKPAPAAGGATAGAAAPIDLAPLAGLELDGRIAIGELVARGIQASEVRATVKAHGGRLDVAPLAARLYGGTLDAKLSAQANGNRVGADATLSNVAVGPLLEAAAGNRLIEGRGTLKLQLASAGASVDAMKRAVDGKASLALVDGAVRGIDLGEKIRQARELLGRGESERTASDATRKTEFSSMTISFDIADGIASSSDLDMRSPLLRVAGDGRIDIGASTIDYTARPSLVATSAGQGGRERDELHGVTIPVRITGALAAPGWQIDWASAARAMLESKAADKLKESLAPKVDELQKKRDDAKEDLKGKAAEKLRGLFNR